MPHLRLTRRPRLCEAAAQRPEGPARVGLHPHGGLRPLCGPRPLRARRSGCGPGAAAGWRAAAWGIAVCGLVMCGLLAGARPAAAQEIEARYQLAVTEFYQVRRDTAANAPEHAAQWRAVAQSFQRIHRDAPLHKRGGDALFSAGAALREAWLLTRSAEDATAALEVFRAFATAYPSSPLRDDSLMHQAALLEAQPDGAMAAFALYKQVALRSPPGPQAPLARARLNALVREARRSPSTPVGAPGIVGAPGTAGAPGPAGAPGTASAPGEQAAPPTPGGPPEQAGPASQDRTPLSYEDPAPAAVPAAVKSAPAAPKGPAVLKRIQVLSALQFTRIIITTDRPVKPKVEAPAPGDGRAGQLRLDFKRLVAAPDLGVPRLAADGVLRGTTVSALEGQGTRLALDVAALERYELKSFELPVETKWVVDLYPKRVPAALAADKSGRGKGARVKSARAAPGAVAAPKGAPSEADRLSLKASLGLKVRTVMLDPGHGGHDPGAIAFGLQEKDLALGIAQRLKALLQRHHPDVRVGMTREEDRFVPLGRRPKLAKAFGADLFVSIHLNASQAERLQGVETYFLNLTSDASALEVAARENATTEKKVSDLNVILLDLLRDTNILESSKLAQALHTELLDTLNEAHPVRDLGVKQAPFMVLIGAEMPSVLVEAGFVTNRGESDRLKSAAYLDRIADGIYAGLDKYISNEDIVQANPRPAERLLTRVAP